VYDRPHMVSSASKNLFSAPSICLCAKPYWTARAESSHSSHIKHLLIYRGAARSVATAPLAGIKPEQRGRAPLCCRWNKCRWNTHVCAPCQYRPRREPDEAARGAPAGAGPDCSAEAAAEIVYFGFVGGQFGVCHPRGPLPPHRRFYPPLLLASPGKGGPAGFDAMAQQWRHTATQCPCENDGSRELNSRVRACFARKPANLSGRVH
jgi:hypothetical protein